MILVSIGDNTGVSVHIKVYTDLTDVVKKLVRLAGFGYKDAERLAQDLYNGFEGRVSVSGYGAYNGTTHYLSYNLDSGHSHIYTCDGNKLVKSIHNGPLKNYSEVDLANIFKGRVGKLLRFTYTGGTVPNQVRIIKLNEVSGTGANARLVGVDMAQPGEAIKSFLLSRVKDSKVEVLN